MVCSVMKVGPTMVAPTVMPRKIVTMLTSGPPAVLYRRSVTVDSRSRLPNISIPISGAQAGTASAVSTVSRIGKRTTAVLETALVCGMSMARSFLRGQQRA